MDLVVYDTKSGRKVPLSGHLKIYSCGPTLYDHAHIGNLRSYLCQDLLSRVIKFNGIKMTHVMNFTDVDDKTIKKSLEESIPLKVLTKRYEESFLRDIDALNIVRADRYLPATDYIKQMIDIIKLLMNKGHAYQVRDGSIFFKISSFPRYGELSGIKLSGNRFNASNRLEYSEKSNLVDFVLWKAYDKSRDSDIFWESPWGRGRPGWHLECSAISTSVLGEVDIHTGGVDTIFPHHENEKAQCEAAMGKPFVSHWVHFEHLLVDGKKMSKSLGNQYLLSDIISRGYNSRELRMLFICSHYRSVVNFTFDALERSRKMLQRLDNFMARLSSSNGKGSIVDKTKDMEKRFLKRVNDDLNLPGAIEEIYIFLKDVNYLMDERAISKSDANAILESLKWCDKVLGVLFCDGVEEITSPVMDLLEKRNKARAMSDWALADQLRELIKEKGFDIEDGPSGSTLKKR